MNDKYFTLIRKDVLDNNNLSLGAKGLYALICYDATVTLKRFLLDKSKKTEIIECSKELEKFGYAHFYNLEECINNNSCIGLHVSIQPTNDYKKRINNQYKEIEK